MDDQVQRGTLLAPPSGKSTGIAARPASIVAAPAFEAIARGAQYETPTTEEVAA